MIYGAKSTTAVMMMKAKSTYGEEPLIMKAERLPMKRFRCRLLLLMKRKPSAVDDGKERRSLSACRC
jgi:hypothetical protein